MNKIEILNIKPTGNELKSTVNEMRNSLERFKGRFKQKSR